MGPGFRGLGFRAVVDADYVCGFVGFYGLEASPKNFSGPCPEILYCTFTSAALPSRGPPLHLSLSLSLSLSFSVSEP